MKVKVVKGGNAFLVIPLDFTCSPVLCYNEKLIIKTVTKEYIRTCNLLEINVNTDAISITVESVSEVNFNVENFPINAFDGVVYKQRQIKDLKTLFLQNAFYFKSLTDNFSSENCSVSVQSFISVVENAVLEFNGTVGGGGLMETSFNAFSFADEVENKTAFLLSLIAKTTVVANAVYLKYGSNEHNPFMFNE